MSCPFQTIAQLDKILEKVAQQHDEMASKFQGEIADLKPREEELKVSVVWLSV